jgi:ligand-binding sensor domain-containing protein
MRKGSKRFPVLAALLMTAAGAPRSSALEIPPTLSSSATNRIWRAQDGLPDQTVQAFAETVDGYLWIATKGGLLRFDGAQFVVFDHANTPGLSESSINCLLAGSDGNLWIGTEGGGLYEYRAGRFRAIPTVDGHSDSFIRVIFKDSRGTVWTGGDQGFYRVSGTHLNRVDGSGNVPAMFVRAIAEDAQGNLWIGGTLLLRLSPTGAVRKIPFPGTPNHNLITSMVSRGSDLWFGTLSGLRVLDTEGRITRVGSRDWTIGTLRSTSDGALWVGTLGNGVLRYALGEFRHAAAPALLPSNTVLAIFEDREHDIWFGTQAGMNRLADSPVTIFPLPGAVDAQFETIYGDSDGSIWCAATHLFVIRGNRTERAQIAGLPPGVRVRTLMRERAGVLWVGTDGDGVFRMAAHQTVRYAVRNGMSNNFARVLLQARDGSMWVGTDGGISHITANGVRSYNTPQGLAYFSVTALLEDTRGDLWVGTSRGLSHFRKGQFISDPAVQALIHEKIWSLDRDEDGAI